MTEQWKRDVRRALQGGAEAEPRPGPRRLTVPGPKGGPGCFDHPSTPGESRLVLPGPGSRIGSRPGRRPVGAMAWGSPAPPAPGDAPSDLAVSALLCQDSVYIFREGALPPYRQMFYQFCDLNVDEYVRVGP